jgi:glycosyltransferase involved in cell wall biosynthesis
MISVIAPCLNERPFIKGWLAFAKKISSDIHVADCGSNDSSLEILEESGVNVQHHKIDSAYNWPEGKIRNSLLQSCKEEWILRLDIDELFDDDFVLNLPRMMRSRKMFIRFPHYCFWITDKTYRVNALARYTMWRFQSRIHLFRNNPLIRYKEEGNHAPLSYRGRDKHLLRFQSVKEPYPNYHYHYMREPKTQNENRFFERRKSGILLATYFGSHPIERGLYEL